MATAATAAAGLILLDSSVLHRGFIDIYIGAETYESIPTYSSAHLLDDIWIYLPPGTYIGQKIFLHVIASTSAGYIGVTEYYWPTTTGSGGSILVKTPQTNPSVYDNIGSAAQMNAPSTYPGEYCELWAELQFIGTDSANTPYGTYRSAYGGATTYIQYMYRGWMILSYDVNSTAIPYYWT